MLSHDERKTETQVRAVARGELRPAAQATEDFYSPPIISNELHGDESLACQKIQAGNQGLARRNEFGP
jgi:hypothetical protein